MTTSLTPSRRTLLGGLAGFGALGASMGPSAAQALGDPVIPETGGDYFLKLSGIPGSSVRDGHEGEIEPYTFSWSASQEPGTKDGKPVLTVDALFLALPFGIHSPPLFQHLVNARRIDSAVLSARRTIEGETHDFLVLQMTGCLVSRYQVTPHPEQGGAMDVVELTFASPPTLTFP